MIECRKLANLRVTIAGDLDGITVCPVKQFLGWDLTDNITLCLCLFRNQAPELIFGLDRKCFHRNHFGFLSFDSKMILLKAAMHWKQYTTLSNQNQ